MNIFAFIFARGGSKGLPGKNIRKLDGKPLIAWSIEQGKSVNAIERIIVSTDSKEIAEVALQYGAEVPFLRPENLSNDDSPEWMAWPHALNYLLETEGKIPEIMVSIPATAPLRHMHDIEKCIEMYRAGGADVVVTVTKPFRNPYFNMVKNINDGLVGLVVETPSTIFNRQQAPKVFDMTTVCYVASTKFVMNHSSLFQGRVKAVEVDKESAIDIDTIFDFKMAEAILSLRKENSEFD